MTDHVLERKTSAIPVKTKEEVLTMKIRKFTSYLLSVVTLITMLFSFRPVSVLADDGQKTEPEVSIEEIQSEIDEKTDIEGETISEEEISRLIEELSQKADEFEHDFARYNQAILFLDMLLRDEGSFELVDKDLPLKSPVYEAGTLRWEAPAVTDKVYLVYVIITCISTGTP
ncbi:MAG: hypothetical protein E7233_13315 [Lachnospiraceae bacterium]|nr:hypothetical protein [Lachnospiraceae bacterium]